MLLLIAFEGQAQLHYEEFIVFETTAGLGEMILVGWIVYLVEGIGAGYEFGLFAERFVVEFCYMRGQFINERMDDAADLPAG